MLLQPSIVPMYNLCIEEVSPHMLCTVHNSIINQLGSV